MCRTLPEIRVDLSWLLEFSKRDLELCDRRNLRRVLLGLLQVLLQVS